MGFAGTGVLAGATAGVHEPGWQAENAVEKTLSRMDLDGAARFESLSSGMKRRVLIAKALVHRPPVLLFPAALLS